MAGAGVNEQDRAMAGGGRGSVRESIPLCQPLKCWALSREVGLKVSWGRRDRTPYVVQHLEKMPRYKTFVLASNAPGTRDGYSTIGGRGI